MSVYNASPFAPAPPLLLPGWPGYSFGGKKNSQPNTRIAITSVSTNGTNNATVVGKILEGPVPIAGNLITIIGTKSASGAYNVTNVALTNVVASTNSDGTVVLTFPLTTAQLAQTLDPGTAIVPIAETTDALTVAVKGQQFAVQSFGVSWAYTCPIQPGALSIQLEGAIDDIDAEYTLIGTAQTVISGYNEIFATLPELVRFVRLHVTSLTGTGTIIGKILNSGNQQ